MHTCMHCWYIHFILNTLIQGFHHHSLLHLQSMLACIADTFNSHQFTWIRVPVIIFHCVSNAYMHACMHCWYIHFILNTLIQGFHHHSLLHALLIHSTHTILPETEFLSLYSVVFAMHTCVHCWYIHFTPNTLIRGFCHDNPVVFAMHACMHACVHCCYV